MAQNRSSPFFQTDCQAHLSTSFSNHHCRRGQRDEKGKEDFPLLTHNRSRFPYNFHNETGVLWHGLTEWLMWDVILLLSASPPSEFTCIASTQHAVLPHYRESQSAIKGTACYLQEAWAKAEWWSWLYHLYICSVTQCWSDTIRWKTKQASVNLSFFRVLWIAEIVLLRISWSWTKWKRRK